MAQAARLTGAISLPQRKVKEKTVASGFKMHVRQLLVVLFNTICGNLAFYTLIGIINRLVGRPIKSVFLFYSVNVEYRRTMIPDWYAKVVAWRPGLGQVIGHGFWRGGLSFGITSNDDDFRNPENKAKLLKLYHDVDFIRRIVGAKQTTFSGILPGVFVALGIVEEGKSLENANTVKVVLKAVDEVVKLEEMPADCPVVVLGGRGFIGRRIAELLESKGRKVYPVDIKDGTVIPSHLRGTAAIILNITKTGALSQYIPCLWREAVVVNEVYPEPPALEQELMRARGLRCYHITGVKASALPRFMKAYKGGIPCCAAYLPSGNFEAMVTKLV